MVNKKAFTLVELIVVVTILAILSTVGFVAFSGYLEGVRDTNRVSQLKNISDGLTLHLANAQLPIPDNHVEIRQGSNVIGYQGYAGESVTSKIEYSAKGLDPKDAELFTYVVTKERKSFALLAFLEEDNGGEGLVLSKKVYAGYANRFPFIEGGKVGVLLDEFNNPIQENTDIAGQGYIDILNVGANEFQLILSNSEIYKGSSSALRNMSTQYDCKRLKDMKGSLQSGVYGIDPDGDGVTTQVYCDMDTDGGGWTIATMLADTSTQNLFSASNLNQFITSTTTNIATKGILTNIWTDLNNRDIYLQCFSDQAEHARYETPFVIYDFPGTEKINLTKQAKAGTEFASVYLSAKWGNKDFILNNLYDTASDSASMEIEDINGKIVFFLQNDQLAVDDFTNPNSPAYNVVSNYQALGGSVYCISAIR